MKKAIGIFVFIFVMLGVAATVTPHISYAQEATPAVYLFGRDDCGFCKAERAWLEEQGISYVYLNIITEPESGTLFNQIAEKHEISKVTPLTIIGSRALVGFNGADTTGAEIKKALITEKDSSIRTLEEHLALAPAGNVTIGSGCTDSDCEVGEMGYVFDLPFLGLVDMKTFSLFSLSAILGTVDGFNPCAMWVLVTFLVLLSQAGSRKKMVVLAGTFVLAEALMYNLILNVWYKTWDFIALDQVVTPLVGLLALGGGTFFLYRWYRQRGVTLVCDISSIDQQLRTVDRFKKVVESPLTIATFGALLLIAFSVNIIEFACSIGIPQAYTKILEINGLSFLERQWYILIYTIGYMFDDIVVFVLAIWGYGRLQAHGQKYAQASLLIGGALMLLLGGLLVFAPSLLVL